MTAKNVVTFECYNLSNQNEIASIHFQFHRKPTFAPNPNGLDVNKNKFVYVDQN